MAGEDSGAAHWSRVLLWAAAAAFAYPVLWLLAVNSTSFREEYINYLTQGLITFLLLIVGSAVAIHWAIGQPKRLRHSSVVAYALLLAWLVVTVAVAWTFWEERRSAEFIELLILSPFFLVLGAPGFAFVAFGAWRERRRAMQVTEPPAPPSDTLASP